MDEKKQITAEIRDYLARERMSREQFAFKTKLGKSTVDKLLTGLYSDRTLAIVESHTGLQLRGRGEPKRRPAPPVPEPPRVSDKPSIAVMPFVNMSGDPEHEFFADGLTEDIITALARLGWLFVIARNSTFVYKNKPTDVRARRARSRRALRARGQRARGYEDATGFGVLSLAGALSQRPPADDPLEPNDDIRYVNGRAFGAPAPAIFPAARRRRSPPTADVAEDPVDVYRVKVRARPPAARHARSPTVGDPDLFVFDSHARSVRRSGRLRGSTQGAGPTEPTVRNRGRRTRTFYVAVGFDERKRLGCSTRATCCASAERYAPHGLVRAPTAPRRGRRCPRAPPASARAGCRAGTTRRPAPPGSPMPAAVTAWR